MCNPTAAHPLHPPRAAEELGRPENKDLKPLVDKLAKAKAAIDAQASAPSHRRQAGDSHARAA